MIEKAPENKLTIERAVKIALDTCLGLEFAHSKGIVHRDLKPGNVWLTEDGRAMIGDFGLAVAVDKSRLTQAGMMVGTVSYMPPEQAMGGEVGPRSDLYSLGAMLYEMVCGRPPFVGDESVAIIGQHLNTPPVAPSWHRPDCPPTLEALILRLLEKDPGRRPTSATEVREALESLTVGAPLASNATVITDAPAAGDNPLYRRTFVGREAELKQVQSAFDAALSGQGGLVMVVGEPGIGKTALCEQLATYVALRGGKALVGHCYEEGSLSLPYLAFVEAMRSYVLAREPDGLRSDLGTGAADVARIVSEVRDRVQGVELRPAGDPEDDRWRLLQAVTSFLRNASTVQPLCIVLEDLHWADRGTLDLLLHVSRNLQGVRLLIVGTYRDVEVDRAHPLSATLAELNRATRFARVRLRGLTIDEVHRMYEAIRGQATPWAQAEAVHRQTEGNPLFVQEVLRYLVEEGFVVREDGHYVAQQGVGVGIPEGLRDVVGKRLSRLSVECNRALSIAAVIGRDFDLATLRAVVALGEEELLGAIEDAVRVGVLEERALPGSLRYRFAHAFFRQTLYEEMIAARRLRLHQEVARALEAQYASRRAEHAAELAEHYGQSTDRADLAKAVEYSELAARRALAVFAYAEAEGHLKRCLEVQEVLDPDDKAKRFDLLLASAESVLPQDDPGRVADHQGPEAFALATVLHDSGRAARISIVTLDALFRARRALGMATEEAHDWVSRADEHAQAGTVERVYADTFLALRELTAGTRPVAHGYFRRALERALELDDDPAIFTASFWVLSNLNALKDIPFTEDLVDKILIHRRDRVKTAELARCLQIGGQVLLRQGKRKEAEEVWREFAVLAQRTRDTALSMAAATVPARWAYFDGRLEEAVSILRDVNLERDERLGGGGVENLFESYPIQCRMGLGVETMITQGPEAGLGTRPAQAQRALLFALLGLHKEARKIREGFGDIGSSDDESAKEILMHLFEAAILGSDLATVRALAPRIAPFADRLVLGRAYDSCTSRLLGQASALLSKPDEARTYYAQALELCNGVRFRPEIALTRLDLAELLLEHYPDEHDAAIEHLDFAIAELRDMKMQPALERALRHRGLLKA